MASSSRAVVTARDAARPGSGSANADDVSAAKLVFRRSLEDVVEAAIKRVLRSNDAVTASGEAQALRDENRQLAAALAEVKRADDREIARLWELIGEGGARVHLLVPSSLQSRRRLRRVRTLDSSYLFSRRGPGG